MNSLYLIQLSLTIRKNIFNLLLNINRLDLTNNKTQINIYTKNNIVKVNKLKYLITIIDTKS